MQRTGEFNGGQLTGDIWGDTDKEVCNSHVERFLREVIIPRLAPISREMCLNYISEKVLDLPRSY